MTKKNTPKLNVVFDTNVLYTQLASDLVRKDVVRIIKENSSHPDLNIDWFLPEVVLGERKYQMILKAKDLLPNLQKMERLLGHQFGIGEDSLELHVDKSIANQRQDLNFKIAPLNTDQVDLRELMVNSINRQPPFDPNIQEKGFRDALIAESFTQLIEKSPSTPSICRLALVTGDSLLQEHIKNKTAKAKNVRILENLGELENLINTIVSTIPEDFAAELSIKATKLFFTKDNEKTFYYKESIYDKIHEKFLNELNNTHIAGHSRNDTNWWILPPILKKKEKQRIYWTSTIEPEFEIYHYEGEKLEKPIETSLSRYMRNEAADIPTSTKGKLWELSKSLMPRNKIIDLKGRDRFEVLWSTNLSQAHNLTSPKIEDIQYIGNNLSDENA